MKYIIIVIGLFLTFNTYALGGKCYNINTKTTDPVCLAKTASRIVPTTYARLERSKGIYMGRMMSITNYKTKEATKLARKESYTAGKIDPLKPTRYTKPRRTYRTRPVLRREYAERTTAKKSVYALEAKYWRDRLKLMNTK